MKKFSLWRRSKAEHEPFVGREDAEQQVIDSVEGGGKKFGVRHYLHQFYSPTMEEETQNAWYLLPPPPMQRTNYVCRVMSLVGLLLLLAGTGLIIIGYTYNWKMNNDLDAELTRISISQDEDGDFFIDKEHLDELLHPANDKWRLSGFIVFAIGAAVIAVSLLIPSCVHFCTSSKRLPFSEDNTPNEAPIRVFPTATCGASRFKVSKLAGGPHKISPTSASSPVPAMQEITSVQPGVSPRARSAASSPTAGAGEDLMLASETEALLR